MVKEWPESPEAEEAKRFVEALQDPQATAFYKELYAFSPTKMTLPPLGTESLPSSLLGPSSPGTNSGSTTTAPFGPLKPEANPSRTTLSHGPADGTGLPAGLLPPSLQDVRVESKTQTPTPKAPGNSKAEPAKPAASLKDLPVDVFSTKPETKTDGAKEKTPR